MAFSEGFCVFDAYFLIKMFLVKKTCIDSVIPKLKKRISVIKKLTFFTMEIFTYNI